MIETNCFVLFYKPALSSLEPWPQWTPHVLNLLSEIWKISSLTHWHLRDLNDITGINPEAIYLGDDHYDHSLCPGSQPGPPSQTPGGLGQRYWSVSVVTWPPKLELRRWGSSGPSSLMKFWISNFQANIINGWLSYLLRNCSHVIVTGLCWW